MKSVTTLSILFFLTTLFSLPSMGQNTTPEGFTSGSVTLANGTVLNGFVKEQFRKKASICFIPEAGAKKKTYDGWELASAKINTQEYLCVKGDFFTVLASGELYFLQKNSGAPGKITYNGTEPVLMGTTEGKPGDYFIYNSKTLAINLVDKATYETVVNTTMGNYQPAVDKANETREDVARLKSAVELYNQRPAK
ncbi:MAG: hypothetical protein JNM68_15775 [Dinghuibacter sp.]|nr:hypothetical protein [Dinghuibacter sp.]